MSTASRIFTNKKKKGQPKVLSVNIYLEVLLIFRPRVQNKLLSETLNSQESYALHKKKKRHEGQWPVCLEMDIRKNAVLQV